MKNRYFRQIPRSIVCSRDQLIKGMVSCRSTRSSFANEAVYAVYIYQFSTLMWHAYRPAQTDTDRDSNATSHRAAGHRRLSVKVKVKVSVFI